LRDEFAQLSDLGVKIIGVSSDTIKKQAAFKEKYQLPFTLLADNEKKACQAFGVKTTLGFPNRQSFLFQNGQLVWRDLKATPTTQAQDIIEFLKKS